MQFNKFIYNILKKDTTDLSPTDKANLLNNLKLKNQKYENVTTIDYFKWEYLSLKTLLKGTDASWVNKIKYNQNRDDNLMIANISEDLPIISINTSDYTNSTHNFNTGISFNIRTEITATTNKNIDDTGLAYQIIRRVRKLLDTQKINKYELINYGFVPTKSEFISQNRNYGDQVSIILNFSIDEF